MTGIWRGISSNAASPARRAKRLAAFLTCAVLGLALWPEPNGTDDMRGWSAHLARADVWPMLPAAQRAGGGVPSLRIVALSSSFAVLGYLLVAGAAPHKRFAALMGAVGRAVLLAALIEVLRLFFGGAALHLSDVGVAAMAAAAGGIVAARRTRVA